MRNDPDLEMEVGAKNLSSWTKNDFSPAIVSKVSMAYPTMADPGLY